MRLLFAIPPSTKDRNQQQKIDSDYEYIDSDSDSDSDLEYGQDTKVILFILQNAYILRIPEQEDVENHKEAKEVFQFLEFYACADTRVSFRMSTHCLIGTQTMDCSAALRIKTLGTVWWL